MVGVASLTTTPELKSEKKKGGGRGGWETIYSTEYKRRCLTVPETSEEATLGVCNNGPKA